MVQIYIYTHLSIQASWSNLRADLMDTAGQDLRVFASKDDCCREKLITDLCCRFLTAVSWYCSDNDEQSWGQDTCVQMSVWPSLAMGMSTMSPLNEMPGYFVHWSWWPMAKSPSPSCVKNWLVTQEIKYFQPPKKYFIGIFYCYVTGECGFYEGEHNYCWCLNAKCLLRIVYG